MLNFQLTKTAIETASFGHAIIDCQDDKEMIVLGSRHGFINVTQRHNVVLVECFGQNYDEENDSFYANFLNAKHGIYDAEDLVLYISQNI